MPAVVRQCAPQLKSVGSGAMHLPPAVPATSPSSPSSALIVRLVLLSGLHAMGHTEGLLPCGPVANLMALWRWE